VIVDPDGEYSAASMSDDSKAGRRAVLELVSSQPAMRLAFRPHYERARAERSFAWLCSVVRWMVDPQPGQTPPPSTAPVLFVVDELADYVGPSFRETPESWQWIVRRGRKYGVSLLAASQRPAQIDKTLFDLASSITVHRLNNADSIRVCAQAINVPAADVEALTGYQAITRDKNTGTLTRA
jgi:hypothetical protein